jgi:hypothetical protein
LGADLLQLVLVTLFGVNVAVKIIGDTLGTPERLKQCQTTANDPDVWQVNTAVGRAVHMITL